MPGRTIEAHAGARCRSYRRQVTQSSRLEGHLSAPSRHKAGRQEACPADRILVGATEVATLTVATSVAPTRALAIPHPAPSMRLHVIALKRSRLKPLLRRDATARCADRKRNGRLAAPVRRKPAAADLRRLRLHDHLDRRFDVGVQMHDDLELADVAQRAFTHHHFRLLDLIAGGGQGLGDIARAD